jgi:hypothetical protein
MKFIVFRVEIFQSKMNNEVYKVFRLEIFQSKMNNEVYKMFCGQIHTNQTQRSLFEQSTASIRYKNPTFRGLPLSPSCPELSTESSRVFSLSSKGIYIYEGVSKFPDWPPGARTAYDTALYH